MVTLLIIAVLTLFFTTAFTAKYRLDIVNEKELRLQVEKDYQNELSKLYGELMEKEQQIELYERRA